MFDKSFFKNNQGEQAPMAGQQKSLDIIKTEADDAVALAAERDVDITTPARKAQWTELASVYIGKFPEWRLVPTIKEALLKRKDGVKCLTHREADIASRGKLDLDGEFFTVAFVSPSGLVLTESDYKDAADLFGLRIRYNNGIVWRETKRKNANEDQVRRGDEMIASIRDAIQKILPMYNFEIISGFDAQLLKPEWTASRELQHRISSIAQGR